MSEILDRTNTVVGDSIIRDLSNGHVEIVAPCSDSASGGVTISGLSGLIDFKDVNLSNYVNLSETGVNALNAVNGYTSIIGVLNQVGKFYISNNDTTADYAENKIVAVSGIVLTVLNDGGNEQLEISINPSAIGLIVAPYIVHNALAGLQGGVSGEFYHLTSQQLIDLTSGLSADNQHFHNASAIVVDPTCFDLVSGVDLQTVLCSIDELLKTRNTLLVNFDIGGSIRNGYTCLGFEYNSPYVQFRPDKEGIALFSARVPENYIVGTNLTAHVKWYSVGTNTNDVDWQLSYKSLGAGDLISSASTVVSNVETEAGVALQIIDTTFTVNAAGFALGDVMLFDLRRLGDNVLDTSTDFARVVEFSLDY
jgi:hypothetical protein